MANLLILSAKWMLFLSWIVLFKNIFKLEVTEIFVFNTDLHCNQEKYIVSFVRYYWSLDVQLQKQKVDKLHVLYLLNH